MEQGEIYVPPKPAVWVPPPGMVPRTQPPAYNIGQPQCPLYPATGPPPPAQVIHTQDPTVYQPDDEYPPASGQHSVLIIDGFTQQQRLQQDKNQCCMMTICALCLCCLLD
ncbi:uncharacterized protein [Amphiura filiformis]|uniref:uncharacterized protein n=1 Tax=Amphiura filiformis TaxID=82378 RepID=UPI003B212000